jgi:hypothetical protein
MNKSILSKDKKIFIIVCFVILLSCNLTNYTVLSFGLLNKYRSHYQAVFMFFLLLWLSKVTIKSENCNYSKLFNLLIYIGILLFIYYLKDLIIVNFDYKHYDSKLLVVAILYMFGGMLLRANPNKIIKLAYYVEILFSLIALLVLFEYLFPNFFSFLGSENLDYIETRSIQGSINRWQNSAYPYAMFAVYLVIILFFSSTLSFTKKMVLLPCLVLQVISLAISNYRATILVTLLFLFISIIIYFFSLNNTKPIHKINFIIIFISFLIFIVQYYSNTILEWSGRLIVTSSFQDDANFQWRIFELLTAFERMSPRDYIFGMGYCHPFYFMGYMIEFLHNGYASILYNFGIVGSVLFLLMLINLIKAIYKTNYLKDKFMLLVSIAFLVCLLIQNFSVGIFNREYEFIVSFILFTFFSVKFKESIKT